MLKIIIGIVMSLYTLDVFAINVEATFMDFSTKATKKIIVDPKKPEFFKFSENWKCAIVDQPGFIKESPTTTVMQAFCSKDKTHVSTVVVCDPRIPNSRNILMLHKEDKELAGQIQLVCKK